MKVFDLFYGYRSYNWDMMRIQEIGNHPQRKVIEKRWQAIWLLRRGQIEELTMLLGASRSSAFAWQKKLRESGGNLLALAPQSRAPKGRRQRQTDARLVEYIRKYRINRPGMGKGVIKAELDRYCQERGLQTVSESTVGRVITDLRAAGRLPGRGLQYKVIGNSGYLISRKAKPKRKKNRRCGYQPKEPGDLLQMDSLAIFRDGIRRYMLTAIDLDSRFAFAYSYTSLNSQNAADFLKKLMQVVPFKIGHIQTDNGGEFEKYFIHAIRDSPIEHFNTYPRHPQSNAYVERFNRTLRSQFLEYYEEDIENIKPLNRDLIEYLLWYNIHKPHRGIGNRSPMEYYMQSKHPHRLQSKMYWTPTQNCHRRLAVR